MGLIESWAITPDTLKNKETFNIIMHRQHNILLNQFKDTSINSTPWLNLQWQRMLQLYEHEISTPRTPVILFKAQQFHDGFYPQNDSLNFWGDISILPITRFLCPGDHETILYEENGKFLAEKISTLL